MEINQNIAKNLLKLRKNAKLTQMELAEKFNYSDKSISKWENGESMPSIEVLNELANFYGTTLDALTKDEDILDIPEEQENVKMVEKKEKMFPTRPLITLLAVSAVWICATVAFAVVKMIAKIHYGLIFLWAVPASCVVLIIFTAIWAKKRRYLFIEISVLLWTLILSLHLQLLRFHLWVLYIIGIPIQIAIVLWAAMLKKKPTKPV